MWEMKPLFLVVGTATAAAIATAMDSYCSRDSYCNGGASVHLLQTLTAKILLLQMRALWGVAGGKGKVSFHD